MQQTWFVAHSPGELQKAEEVLCPDGQALGPLVSEQQVEELSNPLYSCDESHAAEDGGPLLGLPCGAFIAVGRGSLALLAGGDGGSRGNGK